VKEVFLLITDRNNDVYFSVFHIFCRRLIPQPEETVE